MKSVKKNLTRVALKTAEDYCEVKSGQRIGKKEKRWNLAKKMIKSIQG